MVALCLSGWEVQLQAKLLTPADVRELRFVYQTLSAGKAGLHVCGAAEQKDVQNMSP